MNERSFLRQSQLFSLLLHKTFALVRRGSSKGAAAGWHQLEAPTQSASSHVPKQWTDSCSIVF